MASLVEGLRARRGWTVSARNLFKSKIKPGRVLLRGDSRRAYAFDVLDRQSAAVFDMGAVYIYARTAAGVEGNGTGFDPGYIGRTANMALRDAEHERLGDFAGHAFDAVLVLPIDEEAIRVDIEQDLIALHRPVLNDLLRTRQGAETS